jgi:hypothetical protein
MFAEMIFMCDKTIDNTKEQRKIFHSFLSENYPFNPAKFQLTNPSSFTHKVSFTYLKKNINKVTF